MTNQQIPTFWLCSITYYNFSPTSLGHSCDHHHGAFPQNNFSMQLTVQWWVIILLILPLTFDIELYGYEIS